MSAVVDASVFEHPAATRHRFRQRLIALIDKLIMMLDDIDGEADLEDGGEAEPTLGAPELGPRDSQSRWTAGNDDDREEACEDEGAEHDGREPEEDNDTSDYEASLCGIGFGVGGSSGEDGEGTSAPFTLDQSQGV